MKTKIFGSACVFEGKINSSKVQLLISTKNASDQWHDAPFCSTGDWVTIAKAKKLVRDLNKAIAYAEKESNDT